MPELTREDLLGLERYAERRAEIRARMLAVRRLRRLALGDHASLHFENRDTVRYQVQEMLHIERIFEPAAIQAELDAYNPLISGDGDLKATLMLEYPDPDVRRRALARLVGVEQRVWLQVADGERVFAIADEDLPRGDGEKTSAVHFLRFPLATPMIEALAAGAPLFLGCDHPALRVPGTAVDEALRTVLLEDLVGDRPGDD